MNMMALFGLQDLLEIVDDGFREPNDETTLHTQKLVKLKSTRMKDCKAESFIMQTVEEAILDRISIAKTTKESWDNLSTSYKGDDKVKMVRVETLQSGCVAMMMKEPEAI